MAWLGGGHGLWRTKEALQRRCAGPGVELALVPLLGGTGGALRPGGEWVGAFLEACGGALFGRAAFAVRRRWDGGCACEGRTRVLKRIGNRVRTPPRGF